MCIRDSSYFQRFILAETYISRYTHSPRGWRFPLRDPVPNAPNDFPGCHYSAGMNYGFLGKFSVQPDRRDDLVNYLLQAAKLLEGNPGCIHYIVSTSEEPEAVWVSEVWTSVAAHDASLEPQDIRALIQEARPLITGMSDQTQLTVHGGKGLPR